jgi:aspartate carbamoyltransferase catalytic subunit
MHIINASNFRGPYAIDQLVKKALAMIPWAQRNTCDRQFPNSKASLLFLEPSTRTQYSSEQAVMNLGLRHTIVSGADHTSVMKGESFADTFRMFMGQGARIIFIRTKIEGTPVHGAKICQRYAESMSILNTNPASIVNCGDGTLWHPTQYGLDKTTFMYFLHRLDNFKIGAMGDLSRGRTYKTLFEDLKTRAGMTFVHVAPTGFQLPKRFTEDMTNVIESESLEALADCDIVYVTRFQTERMTAEEKQFIEANRHRFIINREILNSWNPKVRIMHPLPRVSEIAADISTDQRVIAFQQAELGIAFRMAITAAILEGPYIPYVTPSNPDQYLIDEQIRKIGEAKPVKYFQPIPRGTVIDGIPAGQFRTVFRILETLGELKAGDPRQVAENVKKTSRYPNGKDVVLLHDVQLSTFTAAAIQAVFPKITVNYLPGDNTIIKRRFAPPAVITQNGLMCANKDCITHHDLEAVPVFIFSKKPSGEHWVHCEYCFTPLWD